MPSWTTYNIIPVLSSMNKTKTIIIGLSEQARHVLPVLQVVLCSRDINSEVQRRQIGELNQRLSALVAKSSSVAIRYCLILVNDYFEHFSEN